LTDASTPAPIVEFSAPGSAGAIAAAIEAYAAERRLVSALVVPWESDALTLRMAVTSTTRNGWAIEHTNLGTISLADAGQGVVRIAVVAAGAAGETLDRPSERLEKHTAALTAFAHQIERKFGGSSSSSAKPETT
jgi:hypothetical protein